MKAMIMAAGVGSRLMPLTMHIPKPMVPMANRPLMENIVTLLRQHGISSIIANLHSHPGYITDYFGAGENWDVGMYYSHEESLLGTAGGVKNCQWFLDDTFVVISGDALTDINLSSLVEEHRKNGAIATIALKPVQEVEQFGVVVCESSGQIKCFQEKPSRKEALSNLVNTGIYVFEPEIFQYIPPRQFYDFGKQVFPNLVKSGAPFYGVTVGDYWCDVGSLQTYREAHRDILMGKVNITAAGYIHEGDNGGRLLLGKGVTIGKDVVFSGVVVIGDHCQIEDNAMISNSIIWDSSVIGKQDRIEHAIIGSGCVIGQEASIQPRSVINSGCVLEAGITVPSESKVFNSRGGAIEMLPG